MSKVIVIVCAIRQRLLLASKFCPGVTLQTVCVCVCVRQISLAYVFFMRLTQGNGEELRIKVEALTLPCDEKWNRFIHPECVCPLARVPVCPCQPPDKLTLCTLRTHNSSEIID